jgi:hypothetical protein
LKHAAKELRKTLRRPKKKRGYSCVDWKKKKRGYRVALTKKKKEKKRGYRVCSSGYAATDTS